MDVARQIGFLLMSGVFVWEGIAHLLDYKSLVAFLAERNFPVNFSIQSNITIDHIGLLRICARGNYADASMSRAHRVKTSPSNKGAGV